MTAAPLGQPAPRPLVLWQAAVAWDGLAGTDRHLATALSAHADVLWVDPPLSVVTPLRHRDVRTLRPRTDRVAPAITRFRMAAPPFPYRAGMDRLTAAMLHRTLTWVLRRSGRQVALVVSTSPHPSLDLAPGARRLYFATDDFAAGAALMGKRRSRFTRTEARRLAEADVLGAVSPEILSRWDTGGRPTFVLPNGCDAEQGVRADEAPLPADVTLPAPVVGMVGQLSPRIDLALLEAVADDGLSLLLVGPRRDGLPSDRLDTLLSRPNVQWVGEKPLAQLPSYLKVIRVGLTPYVDDEFNRGSFPLKILEYLAAGRTVVSTPLPAVLRLDTPWILGAAEPASFVAAVRGALVDGLEPQDVAAKRRFAAQHDWSQRAIALLEAAGLTSSAPGSTGPGRVEVVDDDHSA